MGKGGGDFGARVQIRAHGGSCARTMRSLEDAIRAIGKTGLMFGAARLPRGKGLDVDFAQEKDGVGLWTNCGGRGARCGSPKTRKLVTHVATRADVYSRRRRGYRSMCHTGSEGQHRRVPGPVSGGAADSKWDLVVKEPRGGGGPALYLVSSVRREIRLDRVDGHSTEEVNGEQFFRKPFESVASADALIDVRVVDTVPLDDASVLVARHEGDAPVQADASRLPLTSRTSDATIKPTASSPSWAPTSQPAAMSSSRPAARGTSATPNDGVDGALAETGHAKRRATPRRGRVGRAHQGTSRSSSRTPRPAKQVEEGR